MSEDAVKLRLFPFTLRDRAKAWYNSLNAAQINTWEQVTQAFLAKYFPLTKTTKIIKDITNFQQGDGESLYEAWERFKELQRSCPHHNLPREFLLQTFYNGVNQPTRGTIDAAAGGSLMRKTIEAAHELLEELASNNCMWAGERGRQSAKERAVIPVDAVTALQAQMAALSKQFASMQGAASSSTVKAVQAPCELCGQNNYDTADCYLMATTSTEQVNYLGQPQQNRGNNPYSNTYNPGWKNHPNFSWSSNNAGGQARPPGPSGFQQQDRFSAFESKIEKMIMALEARMERQEEHQKQMMANQDIIIKNHAASIHSLEVQVGQLATVLSSRSAGTLPSHTEANPREQLKAINIVTGEQLEESTVQQESHAEDKGKEVGEEKTEEEAKERPYVPPPPYKPKLPYPQRVSKQQVDSQFSQFLEKLKKLQINLSLVEALECMPKYAKLLKDILTHKRTWEDDQTVTLTENCNSIISSTSPSKLKDPGSFTIPCVVGDFKFPKCLCDLGASINLMPLSVFRELGLGEVKPTSMIIQLVDQSIKRPLGVVEDVLVKVDKFIIPVDFVVLDCEADRSCPLILGRPFMHTSGALVDVREGKLILRFGDERVEFSMFESLKQPMEAPTRRKIGTVDEGVRKEGLCEVVEKEKLKRASLSTPSSVVKPTAIELKPLPPHSRYALIGKDGSLPVIIPNQLDSEQEKKVVESIEEKMRAMGWHDDQMKKKNCKSGDLVLLFNSRLRSYPGKLKSRWSGPFKVLQVFPHGVLEVENDKGEAFKVHEPRCKLYVGGPSSQEKGVISSLSFTLS